jgi:long-chain acyl-CoA synthetase
MLYSSGTTGRPKGVKPALPTGALGDPTPLVRMGQALYGMDRHGLPLHLTALSRGAAALGDDHPASGRHGGGDGQVRCPERAGPRRALARTHGTWVPTHFVRLLKLDPDQRAAHDLSLHARRDPRRRPLPGDGQAGDDRLVGPIVHEYYSGTETCGITALSAPNGSAHPGSVGRAVLGEVHILDDDGHELPTGTPGNVYFANGPAFAYHNDPAKTAAALAPGLGRWATSAISMPRAFSISPIASTS